MSENGFLEAELIAAYREINKEHMPSWAVHKRNSEALVVPTIPFIGKSYAEQRKKIIVYGSAENLADYWKGNREAWVSDWLDDDKLAENRHRKCFEESACKSFFPNVHLGPMNNGCLATAAYYLASNLFQVKTVTPQEFYETIAFANYGKFSIETEHQKNMRLGVDKGGGKANMDYAGNKELLRASHPYIQADLEILKPDCIIIPQAMDRVDREFIDAHRGQAIIVPIYQMNARVINCHIKRKFSLAEQKDLAAPVRCWHDHLDVGEKMKKNYLSVFRYLDQVLAEYIR